MAIAPRYSPLTFSSDDEDSLQKAVSEVLESHVDLNMGLRRCAAFPAVNKEVFLCEMTTKETKGVISKFADKVKGRIFVEHAVIHLMYIPVILKTTHATCELKIKYLATGDELYGGTKVNLNEAFVLTMSWPRSLFAEHVNARKGLYLGGSVSCAASVPQGAKIGMFYPIWSEEISRKQLYQKTVAINNTKALETYTRSAITSDSEMRSLMRSYASINKAAKTSEKLVDCSSRINLIKDTPVGVDFTVKQILEKGDSDVDTRTSQKEAQVPNPPIEDSSVLVQRMVPKNSSNFLLDA